MKPKALGRWVASALAAISLAAAQAQPGPAASQAALPVVRAVLGSAPIPEAEALVRRVLASIGARAGLEIRLSVEPGARARQSWAAGRYELDVARFEGFEQMAPGSHIVRPHLFTVQLVAIGLQPGRHFGGWSELLPLSVAYVRGGASTDAALRGAQRTEPVSSREACVAMAARGRVDVCLLAKGALLQIPAAPEGVALHEALVERQDLFMWAAPGQAALADRLSQTLQAMQRSGELQTLLAGHREP